MFNDIYFKNYTKSLDIDNITLHANCNTNTIIIKLYSTTFYSDFPIETSFSISEVTKLIFSHTPKRKK